MHPDLTVEVYAEVDKLVTIGFIRELQHPIWLANIIPIKKKNSQIQVCIDFQVFNKACHEDDFFVPHIELLIDVTTGHEALSFMNGFSGCNQIKKHLDETEMTMFQSSKGVFCYLVMPFGLKNVGATY